MAVIVYQRTGKGHSLAVRVVVGRSSACGLQLSGRKVSGEHAVVSWDGASWRVRDLASTNGTWVGEVQLQPGESLTIEQGAALAFGDREDPWHLSDAGPPEAAAHAVGGGGRRQAVQGLLLLPSPDEPEVAVFAGDDGWIAEEDGRHYPVADQQVVFAGGTGWRLSLPLALEGTLNDETMAAPLLLFTRFRFGLSRDQEFVRVEFDTGPGWRELSPRTHHYLLHLLAKARCDDAEAPSEAERGWVHVEDLATMAGMEPPSVNVYVSRARQQLAEAGVQGAAGLVERRPGTGMLRFGAPQVEVGDL